MDTKYKSHSFVKLWIATTIFILCCFTTDMSAQNTAAADTVAAVTETITEVVTAPAEEASAAPDTVGNSTAKQTPTRTNRYSYRKLIKGPVGSISFYTTGLTGHGKCFPKAVHNADSPGKRTRTSAVATTDCPIHPPQKQERGSSGTS